MTYDIGDIIQWIWRDNGSKMDPQLILGDGIDEEYYLTLDITSGEIRDSDWLKKGEDGYWKRLA